MLTFGATGDGASDDTAAVAAALRETTAKGRVLWLPKGIYVVTDLVVPDGALVSGAGSGRAWLKGRLEVGGRCVFTDVRLGRDGAALHFADGAAGTVMRRVWFVGGGGMASGEDQGVIRLGAGRMASDIQFVDCIVGANSADGNGVSIVNSGRGDATYHDISWKRCHFLGSPRMNLEIIQRPEMAGPVVGYHHIDLLDCVFEPSGSENISYDAVGEAGACTISRCTFKGAGRDPGQEFGQGIEFNGPTAMRFIDNIVYRCRGAMINHSGTVGAETGTVIEGNLFDGTRSFIGVTPPRPAQTIYMAGVSGVRFTGNTVKTNVGGELMYLDGSSGNSFADNAWTDERTGAAAFACAVVTSGSSRNSFVRDRFGTSAAAAVIISGGSQQTRFRDCLFVLPGSGSTTPASAIAADPGLAFNVTGGAIRQ